MSQSLLAHQAGDGRDKPATRHGHALEPRLRLAVAAAAAVLFAIMAWPAQGALSPAHAARAQNVTDTAHLHYVKSPGSLLLEEGTATGGLPGKIKVTLDLGPTVTGSFTIYAGGGSITGRGSGALHGTGTYASFGGSMTVTGGSGRYAHAHGHGGFYGTLNRDNYAATVQTTGTLYY